MTKEIRSFELTDVEVRETQGEGEARTLTGYASVFDSPSVNLGGFIERVAPTAFTRSLKAAAEGESNIFALWAHDSSQPLGSTGGGKLSLEADEKGLRFSLDVARMTPAQLDAARDGELRMSFGFSVRHDEWTEGEDGLPLRTLVDVDLFEVSPVISPAYPDTSAALRSLDEWRSAESKPEPKVRADQTKEFQELRTRLLKRFAEYKINRGE
ncbi:HK97 family phage prohead protease [Brevundimonas sp. 2R-24]|uniref:HK97 family phage prohead protease n=1 Tax=Peiella sedimenti TaxID=3061083 RepID=A0ABT8SMM5_9CAUL|nr:HK97 family phage prohead protease [Caulobacteraceae bacterium XZ-24]